MTVTPRCSAAVVVASNRAAAGVYDDTTGPLLVEFLTRLGFETGDTGRRARRRAGRRRDPAAVDAGARVVLTTGGTGLTPTDRTPEVTRPLLDGEVPGHRRGDPRVRREQGRPDRRALARPRRASSAAASWSTCPAPAAG